MIRRNCAYAQSRLSMRILHISGGRFYRGSGHIIVKQALFNSPDHNWDYLYLYVQHNLIVFIFLGDFYENHLK